MCILCAPQSSVSGLCARKFRGLHYRILLVPGAAMMDLWTVFCGISDSAGIPVQGTSFAQLVNMSLASPCPVSSVVLSWFSKSVLVDCDSCHRLYKCSILVLSHFCTFLPFTSAFVCCLLYGSLLYLVVFSCVSGTGYPHWCITGLILSRNWYFIYVISCSYFNFFCSFPSQGISLDYCSYFS